VPSSTAEAAAQVFRCCGPVSFPNPPIHWLVHWFPQGLPEIQENSLPASTRPQFAITTINYRLDCVLRWPFNIDSHRERHNKLGLPPPPASPCRFCSLQQCFSTWYPQAVPQGSERWVQPASLFLVALLLSSRTFSSCFLFPHCSLENDDKLYLLSTC
jgi:hypothetical protein